MTESRFISLFALFETRFFLACVMVLTCLSSSDLQAQIIDFESGLVAYFPFNGTADDKTGNGNNGIVNGATLTRDRYGSENSAYYFDGKKSSIRIPATSSIDLTSSHTFTISLWVKPRDINSGCILFKNYDYGIKWGTMNSPITLYHGIKGGFPPTKYADWESDQWYHLVLIHHKNKLSFYINGFLDHQIDKGHLTESQSEDIFIGKHPYFWGAFEGVIDDICIFNRAISDVEATTLYQIESMPIEVVVNKNFEKIDPKDITGVWQGIFSQPGNKEVDNFAYWVDLNMKNGQIQGNSRVEIANTQNYGLFQVSGGVSDVSLTIKEERVIRQYNPSGFDWCLKYAKLRYYAEDESLRGKWYADNCRENGEVILFRANSPFNFYQESKGDYASLEEIAAILKRNESAPEEVEKESVVNRKLEVQPISFFTGSSNLTKSSKDYLLNTLVSFLKESPQIKLKVTGHTDNIGNDAVNLQLSISRARKVVEFLQSNGIDKDRLRFEGYGKAKPIADNATAEGRTKNRRVEFEITAQ